MSIIHYERPVAELQAGTDPAREAAIERARTTLAEAHALLGGRFLQDPQAPAAFGRLMTSVAELLWQLTGGAR